MIYEGQEVCPECGGKLRLYGSTQRIVRTKGRKTWWIKIRRLKCVSCGIVHRELPNYLMPHKQYEEEIIRGVLEGFITPDTLGYENYPCEQIMRKWIIDLRFYL